MVSGTSEDFAATSFGGTPGLERTLSIAETIASLGPWREPFIFDDVKTLPEERFTKVERRLAARKSIFLDPLISAGFLQGKTVLDLGCNAGYWSLECLKGGAAFVLGIETDNQRVAQAHFVRERLGVSPDRYDVVHSDVYEYLAKGKQFDVVLCLGLYYHIEEPMRLMRVMHAATQELLIVDTIVNNVAEAAISVRPCQTKERYLDVSNIGLEFVASRKAISWMGKEAGFANSVELRYTGEPFPSMREYIKGERSSFALGQRDVRLGRMFSNIIEQRYLTPKQDLRKYGYYPERTGTVRDE